jgi:hypothetical protein
MRIFPSAFLFLAALLVAAPAASAQQKRLSPHETISQRVGGALVTVVYGRPYSKDPKAAGPDAAPRVIWGVLVPYGKVWRTGSDEATLLVVEKPIVLGGTPIPAGAFSLYTLPAADGSAQLIVNSQVGQWGLTYNPARDIARIDLTRADLDHSVDQFTMGLAKAPGGGVLKMMWEKTQYSVTYTLAKTATH